MCKLRSSLSLWCVVSNTHLDRHPGVCHVHLGREGDRYDLGGPRYTDVKDRKAEFFTDLKICTHDIM